MGPLSKIKLMSFVNIDLSCSGFPVYLEILIASCSSKIDLGRPGMTLSQYSAEENNKTVGQSDIQSKKGAYQTTDNMKLYKLHDAWILKRQIVK